MKRWEKILVACGTVVIAVEAILILVFRIPIYFPYKIDWGSSCRRCLSLESCPSIKNTVSCPGATSGRLDHEILEFEENG
jgi:hypothetical protein